MIQENILRFVTEAQLSALNAVNKALADQAARLRDVAGASRAIRNPAGQFQGSMSNAQLASQVSNAASLSNRIKDIQAQLRNLSFPNLLAGLQKQMPALSNLIARGLRNASAAILRNITFAGLARNLEDSVGRAVNALAKLIRTALPAAASAAAKAIRSSLVGAFNAARRAAQGIGTALGKVKGAIGGAAGAAGLLGGLGLITGGKAAAELDAQLAVINTIARTTDDVLHDIGTGISEIAATTGTSVADVAQGFYDLLSAGVGVADVMEGNIVPAMKFMEAASKLAVGGIGSVDQAVDLLTTVVNAFRGPLEKEFSDPILAATHVADIFAKTVELGKVTTADLAETFSTAAPLSAQLGLSLEEMGAFLATMTQQGFTAGEALTALRSAEIGLQRNSKALQDALTDPIVNSELAKVGADGWLEYLDVAGFQKFAEVLRDYSERSGIPLIKLLGRIEGVQAILGVTGAQAEAYAAAFAQVSDAQGTATEQAELANDSLLRQLDLLKQAGRFLSFVLLEDALIKPLTEVVKQFRFALIGLTEFIDANKGFFDAIVPLAAFITLVLALTRGADALNGVFVRLAGPLTGFTAGLGAISLITKTLVAPLGFAILGFQLINDAIAAGVLPAEQFVPVMYDLSVLFHDIAEFGGDVAGAIGHIVAAIGKMDPGGLAAVFRFESWDLEAGLDAITESLHTFLDSLADLIFGEFGDSAAANARAMGKVILDAFGDTVDYLAPRIIDTLAQLFQFGSEVFAGLVEVGASLAAGIVSGLIDGLEALPDIISDLPNQLSDAVDIGRINDVFSGIFATLALFVGGWFRPIAIALAIATNGAAEEWVEEFVDFVAREGPRFVGAIGDIFVSMVDLARDVGPEIAEQLVAFIDPALAALGRFAADAIPFLAEATGALIDWVAAAIPGVLSAIATFASEVFDSLTSMDGTVSNGMASAGKLIDWITDRLPGAVSALADFMGGLADWILTTAVPRLAGVMLVVGAALLSGVINGIVTAISNPVESATFIADAWTILFSAAVIRAAFIAGGTLLGIIWRGAFVAAAFVAGAIGTAITSWLIPAGVAAASPAGAAAGAAFRTAFLATSAGAALVTGAAIIIPPVALKESGVLDEIKYALAGLFDNIPGQEGFSERIREFDRLIEESMGNVSTNVSTTGGDINEFAEKSLADLQVWGRGVPSAVSHSGALFKGQIQGAIVDPMDDGMTEMVRRFKEGTGDVVADWASFPKRLEDQAALVKEALKNPLDLETLLADFKANYALITEAQNSGNVTAILNANSLRTTMVESANQINAAFIAAGQAPPLLVNAITGQVTAATVAGEALVGAATTPLEDVPPAFDGAGFAAAGFPEGIRAQVGPAGTAGTALVNAGTAPMRSSNLYDNAYGWGGNVGEAWIDGMADRIGSKAAARRLAENIRRMTKQLEGTSPPTEGPLMHIDDWGRNIADAFVDGMVGGLSDGAGAISAAMKGLEPDFAAKPTIIGVEAGATGVLTATGQRGRGKDEGTMDTAEMEVLLRTIASQLGLGNQLAAEAVRQRPDRAGAITGRGTLGEMKIRGGGRV